MSSGCIGVNPIPCWNWEIAKGDQPAKSGEASSDPVWKEIVVLKRDENGEYILDQKTGKPQQFKYIENTRSGELFWSESQCDVATKCGLIAGGVIFYTLAVMFWNLIKIPIDIVKMACTIICKVGKEISEKGAGEAWQTILKDLQVLGGQLAEDMWQVVSAPIFSAMISAAGVGGIFSPYHFRDLIAKLENAQQGGRSYKLDMREAKKPAELSCDEVLHERPFYLAWCFQVRGHIDETIKGKQRFELVDPAK